MARIVITPEMFNHEKIISIKGHKPKILPWLKFNGEHYFDAMRQGYIDNPFPNGYFKEGTIRYSPGNILLPISETLLVFESSGFETGEAPRGYIHLQSEIVCPLKELTDEEIMKDGFDNRKDMLWQMTKMKDRHYQDLKPSSEIAYFSFKVLNPFTGQCGSDRIIVYPLKKQGDYWDLLKQQDRTGWTSRAE